MKRVNYLNNKDILKEIHKSKGSYCYYVDPKYSAYDFILTDPIEKMTKAKVVQARRNRADRLTKLKAEELGLSRGKVSEVQIKLKEAYLDGRARLNCTTKVDDKWYWFGYQFLVK